MVKPSILDVFDHVAAALPRIHDLAEFTLHIEYADTGGTEHFVRRKRQEVAIEELDIDTHVRHQLGAIDVDLGAFCVRQCGNGLEVGHCAEDVGHSGDGNDLRAFGEFIGIVIHIEAPITGGTDVDELDADAIAQHEPRDDIGVVLEFGEDDFVAGFELAFTITTGDEIDGFRCTAGVNDFCRRAGLDELGNQLADRLVFFGRHCR